MNCDRYPVSRLIGGAILLLLGTLFLLDRFGVVRAGSPGEYWPMLLVWLGLSRLLTPGDPRRVSGTVLLAIGLLFQADQLDYVSAHRFWPLLLLVAGAALIAGGLRSRRREISTPSALVDGGRS
jgi:hypothetical protein